MQAPEQIRILPQALKWLALASAIAALSGTASAVFLLSLDLITAYREAHPWIIAFLPLCGLVAGSAYHYFGKGVDAGNNLILDEIHDPRAVLPARMTPFILLATLATHLFGGSAGREGTAVQMGASLADQLSRPLRLSRDSRRILLMAGMSAGFASVFGTPLAGAVFGLEVLSIGRMRYDAIVPCFVSAILAHEVTRLWGVHHSEYLAGAIPALTGINVLSAILAGAIFGVTGMLFASLTHAIQDRFARGIAHAPLRPVVGGALVAGAIWAMGTTRYSGLGLPVIAQAFQVTLPPWDFALKILFTAVTLGSGFKGGEVTPLFFIGAALGSSLGVILPLGTPLLAALGFVAVFAGAANTPITCTFMAMEIFGSQAGVYAGLACVSAYLFSGHAGIYRSQRLETPKMPH